MTKKGKWFIGGASVVLIVLIGVVLLFTLSQNGQADSKEKKDKMEVKAADEKGIEKRAKNAVANLFADDSQKLLNDTYSGEQAEQAQQIVKQVEAKKVKKKLEKQLDHAGELDQQVQASIKTVQALFADSQKQALAQHVDEAKINQADEQVKQKTPQKKAQVELQKDIEKAKQLLAHQTKQKQSEVAKQEASKKQKETEQAKAADASKAGGNQASTSSNGTSSSNANGQASRSGSSTSPSSKATTGGGQAGNQPIVAKMNLAQRASQIVTVVASGSSAQVKFWQKSGNTWTQVFSTSGQVGSQGVGAADEYHSRTPRGAYSLGFAFGTSNPGTSLPFRQITNRSYWISNVNDAQYNTWQERNSSSKADEHMASYPTQYRYGVVINYNTSRTKGAGSGFFLHCSNGAATAGCVAIPTSYMSSLLQNLHSGAYIVNVTSENELLNY
ncbi:toxin Cry1Ac domain D-VI-related protein [Listeria kieliensis]